MRVWCTQHNNETKTSHNSAMFWLITIATIPQSQHNKLLSIANRSHVKNNKKGRCY